MVAAIALLAAGCRGPSADERYAERVCATTLKPAQQMLDVLQEAHVRRATPGAEGLSRLLGLIDQGEQIARKLQDDLKALPPPNTPAGREASESVVQDLPGHALGTLAAQERSALKLGKDMTLVENIRALEELELYSRVRTDR
jgi:hypothetical protein